MSAKIMTLILSFSLMLVSGCISQKKYMGLETELQSTRVQLEEDQVAFRNLQGQNERLLKENIRLLEENENLKHEIENKSDGFQTKKKVSELETVGDQPQRPYSILLSSCQQKKSVEKVLADCQKSGIDPFVVKVNLGENGIWWRVFAGNYDSREIAIAEKNKLGLSENIVLNLAESGQIETPMIKADIRKEEALLVKK